MRAGRWTVAALAALVVAAAPGAAQLVSQHRGLDRAEPALGLEAPGVRQPSGMDGIPEGPLPDIPITPPPADLSGELAPVVPAPPPFQGARRGRPGEVFALVVGIDDYPGRRSDLRAAVADANTVDQALTAFGVPAANRVVLRNGQARREALVGAIQALVATAGPGTTVVFSYAGHVRKLDGDTEAIVAADGGLLRDDELAALLAPSAAGHMWLLLASCYAGGFTEALAPGRVLTAAADARSLAYESPSLRGSYLVHHMVREGWLEGRAGPSVQEAFAYASARINEEYPNRRPVQIDQSGGPLRLGAAPAEPAPRPADAPSSTSPSPSSPPPQEPPPSSPPPTYPPPSDEPERCVVLLCR